MTFPRLLLTGAGGNLGQKLRPHLKAYCDVLRVSDRLDLGVAAAGEEVRTAALEDADQMMALLDGVSAVVHMGGVSTEQPWAPILAGNIVGHTILYGMSNNHTTWWDNTHAKHIGYRSQDSSNVFRSAVEARQPVIDTKDPAAIYQGGAFVKVAPHG